MKENKLHNKKQKGQNMRFNRPKKPEKVLSSKQRPPQSQSNLWEMLPRTTHVYNLPFSLFGCKENRIH